MRRTVNVTRLLAGLFAMVVLGLAAPGIALADVSVNTPNDETNPADGTCSLREAILLANGTAEPDCLGTPTTIIVPAGHYTLTAGELSLSPGNPLTISGAGASSTIIDANFNGRALNVSSGTVAITGVTIENGRAGPDLNGVMATSCPSGLTNLALGGAILDQGTLTLTSDTFTNNMSEGNGGAVEDAGSGLLSISDSTFTGNNACSAAVSALTAFGNGGAVDESGGGLATIDSSTLSGNAAQGNGGGLAESAVGTGALRVTNSTISGNQSASDGGGIMGEGNSGSVSLFADLVATNTAQGSGGGIGGNDTVSVVNSTIYQNTATTGSGGGIDNGASRVGISFSTINANSAPAGSGGNLANIDSANFVFDNSIIVGGTDSGASNNCSGMGPPTPTPSGGYNLFDDTSDAGAQCGATPTDIVTSAAGLGPLANNGGPTETEALLSGSPAIDAAIPDATVCIDETLNSGNQPVDQRGFPRPDGSETQCDIGAFETQDVSLSTTVFDAGTNSSWAGTEATGASAFDTSSLAGTVSGFPASGTVTYSRFNNGGCSGSPASTDAETLKPDGSVPNSMTTSGLAPGSYSYRASYPGNGEYPSATGPCETFAVAKATPSLSTTVFDAASNSAWTGSETTGASALDTSSLGGTASGFNPSGTVTYSFFDNANCSGSPVSTDTETLKADGSVPSSASTGALGGGSYSYRASYVGDTNYTAATGSCETFAVARATPSVSTTVFDAASNSPWSGSETAGASAFDTSSLGATVNGFTPSGMVVYSLFDNGGCTGNPAATDSEILRADGSVPNSASSGALTAGSYSYQASYSGDANYATASGPCEAFTVNPQTADVGLSVSAHKSAILVGGHDTVRDTITNTGNGDATGVQFTDPAAGFTITSVSPSEGSCTHTRTTVSCGLGTIGPGQSATIAIRLVGQSPGTIKLNSSVSMDQTDPTPADNRASTTIAVSSLPDVGLSATAQNNPTVVGDQDTVTETITNTSGTKDTGVQFTDPTAGLAIDSVTASQGSCTHTQTTVKCALGTIVSAGKVTVQIVFTGLTPGTITLHGRVTLASADPTPADNRQTLTIDVKSTPKPPPPPPPKGPPSIDLARLGAACRLEHSTFRVAATARAGSGIRTVKIRLGHHTIQVYRSRPVAPTRKTVIARVHGYALTPGRTYWVRAEVIDLAGRSADARASFSICKPVKAGFTG